MKIFNGDCLEEMKNLPDKSIDLFICDLPYAETNCKWDVAIDMEAFWIQFKRLRKSKRTACIHFCSTKFGYSLIKSWEKGFKMDMVWKKRNKTGGLASRYRPMRNHEMVYFFYEQSPKYNRDKYHKRINNVKHAKSETTQEKKSDAIENTKIERKAANFEPPNPDSVIEEKKVKLTNDNYTKEYNDNNHAGAGVPGIGNVFSKKNRARFIKENGANFEPPNPASVIEEETDKTIYNIDKDKTHPKGNGQAFDPPNPASVINEKYTKEYLDNKQKTVGTGSSEMQGIFTKENLEKWRKENGGFEPPNPASVLEETDPWGLKNGGDKGAPFGLKYEPPNPTSVLEEFIEAAEDEPVTMFESGKVFIGKRNHQTEKPQDILEFFLKYWSDEGDVILDPTMGSGSTGVACKKLGREFIGFELTEKYFEVAKNRLA
tara:strand:- start:285 stop:1577 length:1293 start_codon:yes stop_codon:yes gene_type:complete